uniref:RING-type E3 ubiquitin transferase n=1 Tax=Eptatretus burgeri TaxID=7764 RepID=A0A8C4MZC0_EPTBU
MMAAALSPLRRFYCHQCTREVLPSLPEYTCPHCDSGFVEELPAAESEQTRRPEDQNADRFDGFEQLLRHILQDQRQGGGGLRIVVPSPNSSTPWSVRTSEIGSATNASPNHSGTSAPPEAGSSEGNGMSEPRPRHAPSSAYTRETPNQARALRTPSVEGIIQQLLGSFVVQPFAGIPWGVLHSHPGDYAWGVNGFDQIITQLLGLDNSGPPPADCEKIDALPTISISKEQAEIGLECSVCREDFVEGEKVRQLPCKHCYHENCIIPWLKMHDTCPVCRKSLNGENTATNNHAFPVPFGSTQLPDPNVPGPSRNA